MDTTQKQRCSCHSKNQHSRDLKNMVYVQKCQSDVIDFFTSRGVVHDDYGLQKQNVTEENLDVLCHLQNNELGVYIL